MSFSLGLFFKHTLLRKDNLNTKAMKINLLLFIIIFFSIEAKSQSLVGTYTRQQLKTKDGRILEKAKTPEVFSYTYSKNKSIQRLTTIQKTTTDNTVIENTGGKVFASRTIRRSSEVINYKDFDSKIYKVFMTNDGIDSNVKTKLPTYTWELLPETKIINGFSCKKATTQNTAFITKQNITAWYTEEIPIKDGPMFYSGLPGFIIQLEIDDNSILVFKELAFKNENTEIEIPNNSAKELSFEEYQAGLKQVN